jgi:hypothetical protein
MESSGATGTDYSDQFIENIVKYIREKPDLVKELQKLLKDDGSFKNLDEEFNKLSVGDVTELLKNNKEVLDGIVEHFTKNKKDLEILLEQANKVKGMERKLEALGNRLLALGIINTVAIALIGSTMGGVTGALVCGLAGLVALVVIGCAIYQYRGKIKEGAESLGKAVKSFMKDLIDKLPTVQARENNFSKLRENLLQDIAGYDASKESEKIKDAQNKVKVIEMLQDEGQQWAIKELIKGGTIQNFSEDEMKRLIKKGFSTHETDKEKLEKLMDDFLPKIMAIGSDIKEVEKKVNEKAYEAVPPSKMETTSSEPLEDPKKNKAHSFLNFSIKASIARFVVFFNQFIKQPYTKTHRSFWRNISTFFMPSRACNV